VLGHALRFAVFAFAPSPTLVVAINVLHGVCYAFFFATVYIFVDEFFPKDARSSAQGLFNFLILGLGPFVANLMWPWVGRLVTTDGNVDFHRLFLVPSGVAFLAAMFLLIAFRPPKSAAVAT
jgi:MFS family permease